MDDQLRQAERSGDEVARLAAMLRAGLITRNRVQMLSFLGWEPAQAIEPVPELPCSLPSACIGHWSGVVETLGYAEQAKAIAHGIQVAHMEQVHRNMPWNGPGENAYWFRMRQVIEGDVGTRRLDDVLVEAADEFGITSGIDAGPALIAAISEKMLSDLLLP